MAVQFNLLPDIKLEFQKAQKAKKTVYTLASLAVGIVVSLFVISFVSVNILQKHLLDSANDDITSTSQKLKNIPNLEKILTVQNQLNSLPSLHQKKHLTSRLFTYLPQVTPNKVHIGRLKIDTAAKSIEISGTADTVKSVNQFIDTLKFTNYITGVGDNSDSNGSNAAQQQTQKLAFSKVVLTKVDRNDKGATYTVNALYDPLLFDSTQIVALVVPKTVTTRSVINTPAPENPLFNGDTGNENQTKQQGGQ
jgi:Tfp pilus assembly protein PilN